MAATQDYIWEQGEDLIIELIYKVNGNAEPMTGYSVRMDIAPLTGTTTGAPVFTFNSSDLTGTALDTVGETDNEVTFPTETPGTIHIRVPRSLTLPGGAIEAALATTNTFSYDLFLRNSSNTQKKILKGKILVNGSITLWE